jgi:hypothetical protein
MRAETPGEDGFTSFNLVPQERTSSRSITTASCRPESIARNRACGRLDDDEDIGATKEKAATISHGFTAPSVGTLGSLWDRPPA